MFLVGFIRGNEFCCPFFSRNNPFKTSQKECKIKSKTSFISNENESNSIDRMEYEISTDKYFNNSNRGKNLFFNIKGNTDNVFRVKRLRCELIEKLNKNSGHKSYNSNSLVKNNSNLNNKSCANNDDLANNDAINLNCNQNTYNIHDNTTRKIQFDCLEVDKNLNIILNNFSKKDMFRYDEGANSNLEHNSFPDVNTNKVFSNLISIAINENLNTNPHINLGSNDAYCGNYNYLVNPLISDLNQVGHLCADTIHDQSRLIHSYNQNENKNNNDNISEEYFTIEYQSKKRKL